jgi:hypothetical protein
MMSSSSSSNNNNNNTLVTSRAFESKMAAMWKQLKPDVRSQADAMAFAVHVFCLESGCTCVGLSEEQVSREGKHSAPLSVGDLPEGWNAGSTSGSYTFVYAPPVQAERQELLVFRCVVISGCMLVTAMAQRPDAQPVTLSLPLVDHVFSNVDLAKSQEMKYAAKQVYVDVAALATALTDGVTQKLHTSFAAAPKPMPESKPLLHTQPQPSLVDPMMDSRFRGNHRPDPFGRADVDPFANPATSGGLMGPQNFPYAVRGPQVGHGGRGVRFDPFTGEPNNDMMRPPQSLGDPRTLDDPFARARPPTFGRKPNNNNKRGGFGGGGGFGFGGGGMF